MKSGERRLRSISILKRRLHKCLAELADAGLLHSACDISDGGIAVALAEGAFGNGVGVSAHLQEGSGSSHCMATLR